MTKKSEIEFLFIFWTYLITYKIIFYSPKFHLVK